jgi:hypothetical protein
MNYYSHVFIIPSTYNQILSDYRFYIDKRESIEVKTRKNSI